MIERDRMRAVLVNLLEAVDRGEVTAVALISVRPNFGAEVRWRWEPDHPESAAWRSVMMLGVEGLRAGLLAEASAPAGVMAVELPSIHGGMLS
jgi:hypothetical protein